MGSSSTPTLRNRIEGCLLGAAIGAELRWALDVHPDHYAQIATTADLRNLRMEPVSPQDAVAYLGDDPPRHGRVPRLTPLIDIGVQAYVEKAGRVAPEDFARALQGNREIADSNHMLWMLTYTTQELLNEGCNPRISGMGTVPSGLIANAMPAVGIFHHADPEYAYLDGVELASVCQPRLGADWAGLSAAAVAAALDADGCPESVVRTVLDLGRDNAAESFRELNEAVEATRDWFADDPVMDGCVERWLREDPFAGNDRTPLMPGPLRLVLPLLRESLTADPRLFFGLMLWSLRQQRWGTGPVVGGAILGALHGAQVFPDAWRDWAEPIARAWHPLFPVVEERRVREREIIAVHETLLEQTQNDRSLLEDKVYGCLLASSIGNAMGSPVEGWAYTDVDAKYPDGITTILDPGKLETEDDNQQMMLLLQTYLDRGGRPVMARHLAQTWCERSEQGNFWPYNDRHSLSLIRQGWDPRITGHWNPMGTSVMCIEPVGLFNLADPAYAVVDASAVAYMHVRGLEIAATSILAAAVAEAMRPDATPASVWDAALAVAAGDWPTSVPGQLRTLNGRCHETCHDYLAECRTVAEQHDDVFAVREELYAKCLMFNWWQSAHLEIVGLPLAIVSVAGGDVRQSAIGGTNIGRDADTNAGRAAMLAGALSGAGNVPAEWVAMFKSTVLERIQRSAQSMAALIAGEKLNRLRHRQAEDPNSARTRAGRRAPA
jgi:ADP-ribosylglycohydrolase